MDSVIECSCGYTIRSSDENDLVSQAQEHAGSIHGIKLTEEQALAMAHPD